MTIPHKQAVIPYLDGLRGRAELYRSVNTIKTGPEGCLGYNTDADGFLLALRDGDITLKGRVLLLGCGGVGRTFACEAALSGCKIVNAVRESDLKQADELRAYVHTLSPKTDYDITTLDEIGGEFDLLINATPVGMYPDCDAMPVKAPVLRNIAAVFDAVYNPPRHSCSNRPGQTAQRPSEGCPCWFGRRWRPIGYGSAPILTGRLLPSLSRTLRSRCSAIFPSNKPEKEI